ncbi:hypothetical protein C7974DRAFT_422794 [Boeremia exigua]|uniref:uncharacterized protein n=1 Tax=Boeremia exigua TaxID=749465 RepID=UPI001E8D1442|nr:uncharacterized protein C7974DRAFT_422794 [Boeremia exigua]KAH6637825.1 hypothetical protein C7974DRAFT_422794 [Boeremia exigua]
MLFISALSAMATALALLTPGSMAADFDVRYSPKKGCGGGAGPVRGLMKGACVPVSSTSVSLRVIDHRSGLKIRGYGGGNCGGNAITAFASHQCHELPGVWSIRVEEE